jgi:hypothetical protein
MDGSSPLENHYDVRHLMRLPLGMSYPNIVADIGHMLHREPLRSGETELVIDETGVGRAVGDIFAQAGLKPVGVTITGGNEETQAGNRRYTVPKANIISLLDAKLHCGELKFSAALREAAAMESELKDFRRHVSESGRYTFQARASKHDDLVLSCGLALWLCGKRKPSWRGPMSRPQVKLGHEAMRQRFAR